MGRGERERERTTSFREGEKGTEREVKEKERRPELWKCRTHENYMSQQYKQLPRHHRQLTVHHVIGSFIVHHGFKLSVCRT